MKIGNFRISKPCYNKYWRCPGWAGPGWKSTKEGKKTCEGGSLARVIDFEGHWKWKFHKCPTCGMIVLPYMAKYITPGYHWGEIKYKIYRMKEWFVRHYNKGN